MTRSGGEPLSIVFVSSSNVGQSGDYLYRVRQPGMAMAELAGVRVVACTHISRHRQRLVREADVLVVDMLGDADLVPELEARVGPTIYELSDNVFDVQPSNPVRAFFADPHNQAVILQLMAMSDAVQTTSDHLTDAFAPYCRRIRTLPNQIANPPELRPKRGPVVVGWGGSFGHLEDIRAIAPRLTRWLLSHPEVRLHMMCAPTIFELLSAVPQQRKTRFETGTLRDYERFLDTLHIGLAPIEPTGFNLCRSDVKLLEYLAHGVVAVCAAVGPYTTSVQPGVNALLYQDLDGLTRQLDRLLADDALRSELCQRGHAYVRDHRQERHHAPGRLAFYRTLLPKRGTYASGDRLSWINTENFQRHSQGYHEQVYTEADRLVHNGLALLSAAGGHVDAGALFERAIALEPDNHLSHCYLAEALAMDGQPRRALEALEQARQRNPASHQVPLQVHLRLVEMGQVDQAVDLAQRTLRVQPSNARLRLALVEQLRRRGNLHSAQTGLEAALRHNPHHFLAWLELGLLHFKRGHADEAVTALERHLQIRPDSVQARFLLACNQLKRQRFGEATDLLRQVLAAQPDHVQAKRLLASLESSSG